VLPYFIVDIKCAVKYATFGFHENMNVEHVSAMKNDEMESQNSMNRNGNSWETFLI
jgi:hypothetical protein